MDGSILLIYLPSHYHLLHFCFDLQLNRSDDHRLVFVRPSILKPSVHHAKHTLARGRFFHCVDRFTNDPTICYLFEILALSVTIQQDAGWINKAHTHLHYVMKSAA